MTAVVESVASSTTDNSQATSITATMPGSVASGDLLLAFVTNRAATPATVAVPDGWEQVFQPTPVDNVAIACFKKVSAGSESGTQVFARTGTGNVRWNAAIARISGHDDVDVSTTGSGSGTTVTCPTVNATVADTLVFRVMVQDGQPDVTPPGGSYTPRFEIIPATSFGATLAGASVTQASSGATGTEAFGGGSSEWIAGTVVIAPAAGGGVETSTSPVVIEVIPTTPATALATATAPVSVEVTPTTPATTLSVTLTPVVIEVVPTTAATVLTAASVPVIVEVIPTTPATTLTVTTAPVVVEVIPTTPSTGGALQVATEPVVVEVTPTTAATLLSVAASPVIVEVTPTTPTSTLAVATAPVSVEVTPVTPATAIATATDPVIVTVTPVTPDLEIVTQAGVVIVEITPTTPTIVGLFDRYWIAGSAANWNDTANWSDTSGGSSGASVPSTTNPVYFDDNGVGNCRLNAAVSVQSISIVSGYSGTIDGDTDDLNLTCSGDATFAGSGTVITGSGTWSFGGNLAFASQSTWTPTSGHTLRMTGSGKTLTPKSTNSASRFELVGGSVTCATGWQVLAGMFLIDGGTWTQSSGGIRLSPTHSAPTGSGLRVRNGGILTGAGAMSIATNRGIPEFDGEISIATLGIAGAAPAFWTQSPFPAGHYECDLIQIGGSPDIGAGASSGQGVQFQAGTYRFDGAVIIGHVLNSQTEKTFDLATNNPDLEFYGNVNLQSAFGSFTWNKGTGTISLLGSANQSIDLQTTTDGAAWVEDIVINKSAGTVTLTMGGKTDSLTLTDGTLDLNSWSFESAGNFYGAEGTEVYDTGNAGLLTVGGDFEFLGDVWSGADLDVTGSATARNCVVSNSDASAGTEIDARITCTDNGGNSNWDFGIAEPYIRYRPQTTGGSAPYRPSTAAAASSYRPGQAAAVDPYRPRNPQQT